MSSAPTNIHSSIAFSSPGHPATFCLSVARGDNIEYLCCHSPDREGKLGEITDYILTPNIDRISCTWTPENSQIAPHCVSVNLHGHNAATMRKIMVTMQHMPLSEQRGDSMARSISHAKRYSPGEYFAGINSEGKKILSLGTGFSLESSGMRISPSFFCQHPQVDRFAGQAVDMIPSNAGISSYVLIDPKAEGAEAASKSDGGYATEYLRMRHEYEANRW